MRIFQKSQQEEYFKKKLFEGEYFINNKVGVGICQKVLFQTKFINIRREATLHIVF